MPRRGVAAPPDAAAPRWTDAHGIVHISRGYGTSLYRDGRWGGQSRCRENFSWLDQMTKTELPVTCLGCLAQERADFDDDNV